MDLTKMLEALVPALGQAGVDTLTAEMAALTAATDTPWKKATMSLLTDAVQAHGPAGIALVQKAVQDIFDHKVPSIDWANPRTASDIVAKLQSTEADDQVAAQAGLVQVGKILGTVASAVIKGMMTAA